MNDVLYEVSQPQMFATFAALRPAGEGADAFTLAGHLPILCWRAATGAIESLLVVAGAARHAAGPRVHGAGDHLRRR